MICTYIYHDPKNNIPIYVGMGTGARAFQHLKKSHNVRLHATIQKRLNVGFTITPQLLEMPSIDDAKNMEILLIAQFGRDDLGTGTLFNLTNGGDGGTSAAARLGASIHQKKLFSDPRARQQLSEKMKSLRCRLGGRKKQPCTVDGNTMYPSRAELIKALGQGKNGIKHPHFKWVT